MRFAGLFFIAVVILAGADPNFSGNWQLNEGASTVRALPDAPWKMMKVEHKELEVHCVPATPPAAVPAPALKKPPQVVLHFSTNGKESAHPFGDATGKSIAKWEGSALMINTIVSGPRNYTQMDRWKLSRDGSTLTIRRQIVNLHGETESTLIYEKL